jgi:hypothetical protein
MENQFKKFSGICLIAGSILLVATMVLHPAGGSIEHMLAISRIAVVSHSLAIFSLPFVCFGFYGLSVSLLSESKVSLLAFIIVCFGLGAAMLAATINGLTLPLFISNYSNAAEQNIEILRPIMRYGFCINKPMDYIFIAAICLAMGIWSVLIIRSAVFPIWTGYFGLLLLMVATVGMVLQFNFVNLFGFRIFIFGMISWIACIGVLLFRGNRIK